MKDGLEMDRGAVAAMLHSEECECDLCRLCRDWLNLKSVVRADSVSPQSEVERLGKLFRSVGVLAGCYEAQHLGFKQIREIVDMAFTFPASSTGG